MVEKANVFPPRSLPGISENWGRHVEQRIVLGEKSEVQLAQKVDNGLRANEGALTTLSAQVNELFERAPKTVSSNEHAEVFVTQDSPYILPEGAAPLVSLPFEITSPREVQVSYHGYLSLRIDTGKGGIIGGFRIVYFTSPPVSNWSNATYLGNTLFDEQVAIYPREPDAPHVPIDYYGMNSAMSTLRLTPGVYRLGVVLWVRLDGELGTVGVGDTSHIWDWNSEAPSGVLTVTPGGPDPTIGTSDIPQYTP